MAITPPSDVTRLLQTAFQLHQRGDFAPAEQAYRQLIAAQPGHPDALHMLGVLLDQTDRGEEGAGLIRRAIGAAPGNADALSLSLSLSLFFHLSSEFHFLFTAFYF